jgi:acetyl esterase/lipase
MDSLVKRFKVPVLVLPAALDRYRDCCVIESMQAMQAAAGRLGAQFEMVVYPQVNHGTGLTTTRTPGGARRRCCSATAPARMASCVRCRTEAAAHWV